MTCFMSQYDDMSYDMGSISTYHCMKKVASDSLKLIMLVFDKLRVHVTLEYRSNFIHFVSASCVFR